MSSVPSGFFPSLIASIVGWFPVGRIPTDPALSAMALVSTDEQKAASHFHYALLRLTRCAASSRMDSRRFGGKGRWMMSNHATIRSLFESCTYRNGAVHCPRLKLPASILVARWRMSYGQWTSTVIDCQLLRAVLMDCDMSCLSQLVNIEK